MMGDVYEKAWRVLVWLGPEDESTSRVFRLLRAVGCVAYWPEGYRLAEVMAKPILERLAHRPRGTIKTVFTFANNLLTLW